MSNASKVCRGIGVLSTFVMLLGGVARGGDSPATPAVTVHSYKAPDGQVYGALLIKPDRVETTEPAKDIVVLVDTSASQTGEFRTQSIRLVKAIVASFGKEDRAQLIAVDVAPVSLTAGFVKAGSAELASALSKLDKRAPLGTCDLYAGLVTATGALSGQNERAKAIVFVGDGVNSAGVFGPAKMAALTSQLRSERIVVHTVGIGGDVVLSALVGLASVTGGRCISEVGKEKTMDRLTAAIGQSLRTPVIYTDSLKVSDESLSLVPNPAPPLRADQTTLFLTRGDLGSSLTVSLEGKLGGKNLKREWSVTPAAHSEIYSYLPNLWEQWQHDKRVAATGDGRESLALAQADHTDGITKLLVLGQIAATRGMLDEAEKFANEALKNDPRNIEAKTLLRSLATKQQQLALAQDPKAQDPAAGESKSAPQTEPQQPKSAAPQEPKKTETRAEIPDVKERDKAATELLRKQTTAELDEARKLMSREPEKAINLLKGITLLRIDAALDAPESDRSNLRRQVESALRQAAREKERVDLDNAERQRREAGAAELHKMNQTIAHKDLEKSQNMEVFWALMQERSYREALTVARAVREKNYGDALPELGVFMAETSTNWYELLELREVRKHRLLLTLIQIDKSHIPFPDEPPVEYPDATWWEEMTKRRKKWSRVDLTVPSKAEDLINEKLKDPVTMEFVETPLSDVIDFLKDYTGVNIVLDKPALEEEGINSDTPVSIHVQSIALKSALKILLGQYNLTFLIKDDVLQITSKVNADNELIHKVYPVADLVIPVGGMGGGMMGGMMGGGGGGMMGGGGGGMMGGGGMGGGGGGMMGGGGGGFGMRNVGNGGQGGAGGAGGAAGQADDLSDDLIELIEDTIAPDTWDVRGGQGSIRYYRPNPALIIRQTSEVHGDVGDVLGQVRGGSSAGKSNRSLGLRNVNP
jgi:hypothetical protein